MIRLWRGQGCLRLRGAHALSRAHFGPPAETNCVQFGRARSPSAPDGPAVRPYLKNDDGVAHAYEVFHSRGVPVGEANTAVACRAANCLGIIRAMNTDSRFIQAHP